MARVYWPECRRSRFVNVGASLLGMPRSRIVTVVIMACSLVAAILFGAAAVLGWALARPIGIVAAIAAVANIALISAPTGPRARRAALVAGASVLVVAAASGAWGFIADVPWWLCLMPIGGAVLMVPEILDLMATTQTPTDRPTVSAAPAAPPVALPPPTIDIDEDAFFADRTSTETTSTPSLPMALGDDDVADDEDTLRHLAAIEVSNSVEETSEQLIDAEPSTPVSAPSAPSADEELPVRGRRAVLPDDWDDDEDDETDDAPPVVGRRALGPRPSA